MKDLIKFLDNIFVKKAPFQIPKNGKEFIVQYGPWITLVIMILMLPAVLAVFGAGSFRYSMGQMMVRVGSWYYMTVALIAVELVLMGMAIPLLIKRKIQGWNFMFYAEAVSILQGLLIGNGSSIIGTLIGAVIGFYIIFQVREYYK